MTPRGTAGRLACHAIDIAYRAILRNRLAIGLASLAWLVLRSGTQPRRLSYPCQRAAAANLGVLAFGLVPAATIWRRVRGNPAVRCAGSRPRQVIGAAILVAIAWLAIESYPRAAEVLAPELPRTPGTSGPSSPTTVAIVKMPGTAPITEPQIESMVRQAVALAGGLQAVIPPGARVIVKPNLVNGTGSFYSGSGMITHRQVTRTIVRMAMEAGAGNVSIAEGCAGPELGTGGREATKWAYYYSSHDLNLDGRDDETGVALLDLNDAGGTKSRYPPAHPEEYDPAKVARVDITGGLIENSYWLPRTLVEQCDVFISVACLKNHELAGTTGTLKNLVGIAPNDIYHYPGLPTYKWALVHDKDSWGYAGSEREYNAMRIADLARCRPIHFAVIDGLVGITNGPVGGTRKEPNMRLVMAGRDPVAVDTVATLVMGYDPWYVDHIVWSEVAGHGTRNTALITVLGDHVAAVRSDFPLPYGGNVRANAVAPTMTGLTPADGAAVRGTVDVIGTGVGDDNWVVKAELCVDGVLVATRTTMPHAAFQWDTTAHPDGLHVLQVTVYDRFLNEKSLTRNVYVTNTPAGRCDSDHDGDVDVSDFGFFQACFNGPGQPAAMGSLCGPVDLDDDGDVDVNDFAGFQACYNGPGAPAACR